MCTTCATSNDIVRTLIDDADRYEVHLARLKSEGHLWAEEVLARFRALRLQALATDPDDEDASRRLRGAYDEIQTSVVRTLDVQAPQPQVADEQQENKRRLTIDDITSARPKFIYDPSR